MKNVYVLFLAATLFVSYSCKDKKAEDEKDGFQVERKKATEKAAVDENTIALASDDLMQFDKNELKVKAGKKVTLTLRHTGKMDKLIMGHNFVLLKSGTDVAGYAAKAAAASKTEYIPEGDETLAHTKLIGGGESTAITFDPPAPGTYDFICSFPGHFGVMQGKFIVE